MSSTFPANFALRNSGAVVEAHLLQLTDTPPGIIYNNAAAICTILLTVAGTQKGQRLIHVIRGRGGLPMLMKNR
jgi:hypothetical protein